MLDNFISELCGNQNMPLAAPWWDNLFWALRQNPDFSSLPKMDLKQTGLTFTTKTFRWRSQEMYEIGAPPSLVRSLQSQYLICRVKASLYHFEALGWIWFRPASVIGMKPWPRLVETENAVFVLGCFANHKNRGRKAFLHFRDRDLRRHSANSAATFSTEEEGRGHHTLSCSLQFLLCGCTLYPGATSNYCCGYVLPCRIISKESTAWKGPRRQIEAKWGKRLAAN